MDVKKELIIGIVGSVFIIFLTFLYLNQYQKQKNQFKNNSSVGNVSVTLTNNEIAKHNSASDCWIIIQNSVYNVTQYLNLHPGGSDRIIPFCGQDASSAYATKGGQGSHSSSASQDLALLKLGQLNKTVNIKSQSLLKIRKGFKNDD